MSSPRPAITPSTPVQIHTLHFPGALLNTASPYATTPTDLHAVYTSPYTGAITTRTSMPSGFPALPSHAVAFHAWGSSNSFGFSPHTTGEYVRWVEELLRREGKRMGWKPVIVSVTGSEQEVREAVEEVQGLRRRLDDGRDGRSLIGVEINLSCPNIPNHLPPSYSPASLAYYLSTLRTLHASDPSLTIGLKLSPFVYADQFAAVLSCIEAVSPSDPDAPHPISFLTSTNTLGCTAVLIATASSASVEGCQLTDALPTPYGGLAGHALHPLSLGNVRHLSTHLSASPHAPVRRIALIGAGGVDSRAAFDRMVACGVRAVGLATALGVQGIEVFGRIARGDGEQEQERDGGWKRTARL